MNDKQLEKGLYLVLQNAESLIIEAKLLLSHKYFARAYGLTQLAIEEIGKSILIYKSILDFYMGENISNAYLKEIGFWDHQTKTKHSIKSELITIWLYEQSIGKQTNFIKSLVEDFNQTKKSNTLKNQSLYVDIVDDVFVSPSTVINSKMALELIEKADFRLSGVKPILKPLSEMKLSADRLKRNMENPEEHEKLKKRAFEEFGILDL